MPEITDYPPQEYFLIDPQRPRSRHRGGVIGLKHSKELKDSIITENVLRDLLNVKCDIVKYKNQVRIFIKDNGSLFNQLEYVINKEKTARPQGNRFNPYFNNTVREQNLNTNSLIDLVEYLREEGYEDLTSHSLLSLISVPTRKWWKTEGETTDYLQYNPDTNKLHEYNRHGETIDQFLINEG